jgi:triacylglycerol lipase
LKFLPTHWAAGGTVHGGFAGAFDRVKEPVLAPIDGARPDGKVLVTGHSLGAALATLTASLASQVRLVTFGSPRVGDSVFTSLIGSDRHDRFVDYLDVVTRIPPDRALGFVHGNRGHFIDRDGTVQRNLSDQDIVQRQRAAGCVNWTTVEFLARVKAAATRGNRILVRYLTDHAPINYTSGCWASAPEQLAGQSRRSAVR